MYRSGISRRGYISGIGMGTDQEKQVMVGTDQGYRGYRLGSGYRSRDRV